MDERLNINKGQIFTEHSPKIFKNVFSKWKKVIIQFANKWESDNDIPWWYNERALLSMLSSAVWLEGGMALEEYSKDKVIKNRQGKKERSKGRQDIYISIGNQEFIGECKICWSSFAPSKKGKIKPISRIQTAWDGAVENIHDTPAEHKRKLAILFIRPAINVKKQKADYNAATTLLKEWHIKVMKFIKNIDSACCAWIHPPKYRTFVNKGYIHPGIVMLIVEFGH